MFASVVVGLCIVQAVFVARHWLRVTARDRNASRLRQLRVSLDWQRVGHRSRIAAGASGFGELRGQ